MQVDEFFGDHLAAFRLHKAVEAAVLRIGPAEVRASRSQISFCRRHVFAATWMPQRYLRGKQAPLVLSIFLRHHHVSPRWKEVVEPADGRFTHHLELRHVTDVDDFVRARLEEAWREGG